MLDGKPLSHEETMQFLKDLTDGKFEKERQEAMRKEQEEKNKLNASNKNENLKNR